MVQDTEPVAGSCEHGNEPSGSIQGGEFLDQLSECSLLKKDSALRSYFKYSKELQQIHILEIFRKCNCIADMSHVKIIH
jgi:hypothetical protein